MKWSVLCLALLTMCVAFSTASAQGKDSTYSDQGRLIDSLRSEVKKIESSYRLLKQRTDSTKEFSESDREELDKLSQEMSQLSDEIREANEDASRLAREAADVYDVQDAAVRRGDYTLEEGDVMERDVKVLNGDAFIYGTVEGSIIVVNGDAFIRNTAKVEGDVVVINGKAHVSGDAKIEGNVVERGGTELEARHSITHSLKLTDNPELWRDHNFIFEHIAADYNRVDGLFLGLGQNKEYFWSGAESISPFGFAGYAFSLHRWRYQLGLDKWFGNENRFEVGFEGHSLTDSKDYWIIGPKENSLYSVLAREDFMDYFSRDGVSFHLAQYYQMDSRVTLSFDVDKYSSLSRNATWSIFGGHKSFRENPAVQEGWMRSVVLDLQHREYKGDARRAGWLADLRGEATVSGAYDFRMITAEFVRYQPLFKGLQLNLRLRAGTSDAILPLQRTYQIGGFNTLNAFPYKEFSGNRLLLCNFELLLSPDLFRRTSIFPLNTVTLILFGDAGEVHDAGAAGIASGWDFVKLSTLKSDYGVGVGNGSGSFRIFLAWRTDISASPTFGVRVSRPF